MSFNDNININNEINRSFSMNEELNPIVYQLIEFGYDNIYSRRVFHYFHPDDLEEALNYMAIDNGIIQHRFIKDNRNKNNKLCYICGEIEEIHLKELSFSGRSFNSNNNNTEININNNKNNIEQNNSDHFENLKNQKGNELNKSINNLENIKDNNNLRNNDKNIETSIKNHSINNNINDNQKDLKIIKPNKKFDINDEKNNEENINENEQNISFESIKNVNKELKNTMINFEINPYKKFNNEIKNRNTKVKINDLKNDSTIEKGENKERGKKECPVCGDGFLENSENKVKKCGHSFCNGCWFDFLSIKIKENKLPSIKCLEFTCESKLNDEFIMNLLNSDINLIKKYKKYKLELEVINDPNKKLCPFPNCDSFLQLKEIKNQYVTCENNHTYCFVCLKEPHGNIPCNEKIDKSIIEYAKNTFVKKCPNCSIITEKQNGCNHITCAKCQYQWCWLCNKKYESNHFYEGKCKGFQFFKPKNEYEIKLMMEGKINSNELSESQLQEVEDDSDIQIVMLDVTRNSRLNDNNDNINREPLQRPDNSESISISHNHFNIDSSDNINKSLERPANSESINISNNQVNNDNYDNINIMKKIFHVIIFIFFGNILFIIKKYHMNYFLIYFMIYLLLNISFFFPLIFLNIFSFFLILIFIGFKRFILAINNNSFLYTKVAILIIANLFIGIFCKYLSKWESLMSDNYRLNKKPEKIIIFFHNFITLFVVFFPTIIFYNFIYMIILFIKEGSFKNFLLELDIIFENSFGFRILELNDIYN